MSEKKISYTDRTFDDYKKSLLEIVKTYYPNISDKFEDASIGSWLIDMAASIGDNLSYHIDRVYNETNIESANEKTSIMSIARSNGLKIPGPTPSVAEEEFTCYLPVCEKDESNSVSTTPTPNYTYAPIIKKGTKISNGSQFFEVADDIDFKEDFNVNGVFDKEVFEQKNGKQIVYYKVKKRAVVYAGETKIYKQVLSNEDIKPFMEIVLPDANIMNIESIIFKTSTDFNNDPLMSEFSNPNEFVPKSSSPSGVDTYRFFEVNSLAEQYRWGDDVTTTKGSDNIGKSVSYTYGFFDTNHAINVPTYSVTKGQWIPLTQKFITEYTDNGYMKIIFGCGEEAGQEVDYSGAKEEFSKYQISRMVRNNFLGKLPKGGWTMYVQYRVGGGKASNVAVGQINQIAYLNAEIRRCLSSEKDVNTMAFVKKSISCTNTTPSVSGKDAPSVEEIKAMIKYNNASQDRCVTLKDYVNKVKMMPPKYGAPFRVNAIEENNKIFMYLLGIDNNGRLSTQLPEQMIKNIENYLSMYRSINDYVEIKNGRIINLSFELDICIDKNYDTSNVEKVIVDTIKNYMDVNNHDLGSEIFVGDLEKEIMKTDGVLNLSDLRIYNVFGPAYSQTNSTMEMIRDTSSNTTRMQINLDANDYTLTSDSDEMFEVKYPESDIVFSLVKVR